MKRWAPVALAFARVGVSALVLASGFRGVSDDDFARVAIAERWAHAPLLDPSGTSWLPLPFWLTGAAMMIAGRTLDTARAVALALGVAATLLIYLAARWLGEARPIAAVAALSASLFPWSARLGVATVPELPTAALTLLAIAALTGPPGRRRVVGGVALLAATLSRYEAWPVAALFAGLCLLDAARSPAARAAAVGAAALALAGPLAWMAWNHAAHGDALHFLARVAAYRQALGGADESAATRLVAYPVALLREAPEVAALLGVGILLAAARGTLREQLARWARPLAFAVAQVAALSLAMVKDGAPTHHPERAVLVVMLLAAALSGVLAATAIVAANPLWRAIALGAVGGAVGAALVWARPPDAFVRRADEEAIGRTAREQLRPGEPVLIEVVDYGHLAVVAALGRPEDAIVDRSIDPRDAPHASSFAAAIPLRDRLTATGAWWVIARPSEVTEAALGAPVATRGAWALFRSETR